MVKLRILFGMLFIAFVLFTSGCSNNVVSSKSGTGLSLGYGALSIGYMNNAIVSAPAGS